MSLAAAASLISASLDLQLVRLIRAAINADHLGAGVDARLRPRAVADPSPRFEPRAVIEPTPRFEPRPVIEPVPRPGDCPLLAPPEPAGDLPAVYGPLPAPWQLLLRRKAWDVPVARPISFRPIAPPADITVSGRLIDQFV